MEKVLFGFRCYLVFFFFFKSVFLFEGLVDLICKSSHCSIVVVVFIATGQAFNLYEDIYKATFFLNNKDHVRNVNV